MSYTILTMQTLYNHPKLKEACKSFAAFTEKNIAEDNKTNKYSIFFDIWEVSHIADVSAVGQFL